MHRRDVVVNKTSHFQNENLNKNKNKCTSHRKFFASNGYFLIMLSISVCLKPNNFFCNIHHCIQFVIVAQV